MTDATPPRVLSRDDAVTDNAGAGRYELHLAGELAGIADYQVRTGVMTLPHTVIDGARRGQGLGARLVAAVLDDARDRELRVDPQCWYVAEYIGAHPEYRDLLT